MSQPTVFGPVSTLDRYPSEGEVNLDFTRSLPEGFVHSRDTPGCYMDADGYPRIVGPNVPMFEKDGLLLDGANTNYLHRSEIDSGTAWGIPIGLRVDGTYKYGDITMARIRESDATQGRNFGSRLASDMPIVAGTPICLSGYCKQAPNSNDVTRVIMFVFGGSYADGSSITWRVYFNPRSGTSVASFLNAGETTIAVKQNFPDSMVRYAREITTTQNGTITSCQIYYADGGSVSSFLGDGVSGIDIGGWQLSYGKLTSYIRSGNTATTRAMDSVIGPVSNILGANTTSGTRFADFDLDGFSTAFTTPVAFRENTTTTANRITISVAPGNSSKFGIGAPVNFNPNSVGMAIFPGPIKTALRVDPANIRSITNGSLNGGSGGTGSPAPVGALLLQAPEYRRIRFRYVRSTTEILTGDPLYIPTRV